MPADIIGFDFLSVDKKTVRRFKGRKDFAVQFRLYFCAGLIWAAFLTGLMIFGIHTSPPKEATVVVLGSKVSGHTPSADLRVRIDAAASYLLANPQAKCIVSGGRVRRNWLQKLP